MSYLKPTTSYKISIDFVSSQTTLSIHAFVIFFLAGKTHFPTDFHHNTYKPESSSAETQHNNCVLTQKSYLHQEKKSINLNFLQISKLDILILHIYYPLSRSLSLVHFFWRLTRNKTLTTQRNTLLSEPSISENTASPSQSCKFCGSFVYVPASFRSRDAATRQSGRTRTMRAHLTVAICASAQFSPFSPRAIFSPGECICSGGDSVTAH